MSIQTTFFLTMQEYIRVNASIGGDHIRSEISHVEMSCGTKRPGGREA